MGFKFGIVVLLLDLLRLDDGYCWTVLLIFLGHCSLFFHTCYLVYVGLGFVDMVNNAQGFNISYLVESCTEYFHCNYICIEDYFELSNIENIFFILVLRAYILGLLVTCK